MPDLEGMLTRLRARIVRELYLSEWREVWFFPRFGGVDGWRGTQDIMFVGLNPSTGRFPSHAGRMLYALRRNGFKRAHLTDVIKERATASTVQEIDRDRKRMRKYRRYLLAEIKIVRPRLIVAMGRRAYGILTTWLGSDARVRRIPHYAARFPTAGTRRRFASEMARIRREYERMRGARRH